MGETQGLKPGAVLRNGTYKIEKVLGQGGFGITYLATDLSLDRFVAIKEFFPKDFCDRDATTSHVTLGTKGSEDFVNKMKVKFQKEARNIAKFDYSGIIRIYAAFEENNTAYYVMEYIDGGSLLERVKINGPLPAAKAVEYITKVGHALEYVHERKINHLDVKPANIMVRRSDDEPILIDFGLSKQYDSEGNQTSTTPTGISHGFAPFEQYLTGGVKEFSPQTDIYSLGATLYYLLSGVVPPQAPLLVDDALTFPKSVPANLVTPISKAMEISRKHRYSTVALFLKDLTGESEDTDMPDTKKYSVNGVTFEMVTVEGGSFQMGSNDSEALSWEKPVHSESVSTFCIGKTEVTQALWKAVMGSNPSRFKGDNLPVECLSWNDCKTFISKLNSLTGESFRLPTEAEWEYAARGGNKSHGYTYSGSNKLGEVAWYTDNAGSETHPVASKSPNELGIYDMSGNVLEWTSDLWCSNYNSSRSGSYRVRRGGSWSYDARCCRVSNRDCGDPSFTFSDLGFRLAL
jgi:formylglycine-generating enzyme required for sulfatase activity